MKKMLIACVAAVAAVCGFAEGGETTDTTTDTTTETTSVGVNFCSEKGADTTKALFVSAWTNNTAYNEGSTVSGEIKLFNNSATLTFSCKNAWRRDVDGTTNSSFLNGYFDDGNNGTPITISCTNIPFDFYDVVIYYASDEDKYDFTAPTVNGAQWTYDSDNPSVAKKGSNNWGASGFNDGTCGYGTNVLRIVDRTGYLSIASSGSYTTGHRGSIAAIQIMKSEKTASTMTVGGEGKTSNNWSDTGIWTGGTAATNGVVIANLQGDATVTVDQDIALNGLTVKGGHQPTLAKTDTEKTATIDNIHIVDGTSLVLKSEAITIGCVDSVVTNTFTALSSLISRPYGNVYTNGAGSAGSAIAMSAQGGSLTLSSGDQAVDAEKKTYYVSGGVSATQTKVVFDNVNVDYGTGTLGVGQADYILSNATVTAKRFYLSDGGKPRTATFTMNGKSSVTVSDNVNADDTNVAIMFGFWNGPTTFTMNDESTFTASNAQVLVGRTFNDQTININGGTLLAKGFKASFQAGGTNKMNLNDGTLVLGDVGITRYSSCQLPITVGGNTTIKAMASTLPISETITVADGATLTIQKDEANANESALCTLSGAISGTGKIAFGEGVNVNLSTARCAENDTTITVLDTTKISATLANALESFTFKIENFKKENFTLYNVDGQTEIEADVTVSDNNVVTICSARPRFTVNAAEVSLDVASCWSVSTVPTSGDITITNATDAAATITVPSACVFTNIYIVGSGKVTFKYADGATLNADGATISLQSSDVTLVIDGVANTSYAEGYKNTITGVGKVETLGNVKMTKASSFTGGLTVKSGTLSTSNRAGFGGASDTSGGAVVVENGATVDLANAGDRCYAFTIAGKGVATTNEDGSVSYAGAIKNSGGTIGRGTRQTRSITLAGDALITVDSNREWGILQSGYGQTALDLAGHTLTKQGAGSFFLCNTQGSAAGAIVVEEGTLEITCNGQDVAYASSLSSATVKMMPGTTLNMDVGFTASLVQLYPQTKGINIIKKGNLTGTLKLDATGFLISEAEAEVGKTYTLVTGTKNTITNGFATVSLGSRVKTDYAADGSALTVTIQKPVNLMHYDFNQSSVGFAQKAADSTNQISWWGDQNGNGPFIVNHGKTGTSAHIFYTSNSDRLAPYWDNISTGAGYQTYGVLTVTAVSRVLAAGRSQGALPIWGLGATANSRAGFGLVAVDKTTAAVVTWASGVATEVCRVENIPDMTKSFHFFAIVLDGTTATLYVDKMEPATGKMTMPSMGQCGQFGSFHGGVIAAYPRVQSGDNGLYLDDWAVYDAALFESEVNALRKKLLPDPFVILVK